MKPTFIRYWFATASLLGWLLIAQPIAFGMERPSVESVIEGVTRADHAFFESAKLRLRYARTEAVNIRESRQMRLGEWLLGRDDDGWYTEARELEPGKRGKVTIPAEPTIFILKNGRFLDWTQHNRNVFLGPKEKRNFNVLFGWQYLENAGFNPYRPVVESTGMSYEEAMALDKTSIAGTGLVTLHQFLTAPLVPDVLKQNASRYTVAEQPESIDGEACWAIEWPGMDKIWVNVDRGYTVRRRVYHWNPEGPLARQVDNSDFREVKPGLWFCFRQTVETYGRPGGDEADLGKIINRCTYVVSEFDFTRAPDALTTLRLPAGTFVTDAIRNLQYKVSDEEGDPFEKPLSSVTSPPPSATATGGARRTGLVVPIVIANAAILVLIALFFFLRRKKAAVVILVALHNLPASATAQEHAFTGPTHEQRHMVDDKGDWLWKPTWLEMNACGPNSLFVLLKLLGENVTLDQVKNQVECDPIRGCSMADLSDAASALGVPADVRFVRPDELADAPLPYILHGTSGLKAKTGHFTVVVRRDPVKHLLATIDPIRESFQWNPEGGFVSDYSGYILVPRRGRAAPPHVWLALGLTLLSAAAVSRHRAVKRAQSPR